MHKKLMFCLGALWAGLVVAPAFAPPVKGQTGNGAVSQTTQPVTLFVTVTDPTGRLVTGLESRHFAVFENEVRQTITAFDSEDLPVSLGVALNVAGGGPEQVNGLRDAVQALARPGSELFLTNNAALPDAVALALGELAQRRQPKRAVLILSDGRVQTSDATFAALRVQLQQSGVPVYVIGFAASAGGLSFAPVAQARLSELAQLTGGQAFFAPVAELKTILARLVQELRHQYRLVYTADLLSGHSNKLRVELHPPRGLPLLTARVSRLIQAAKMRK